MQWSNVYLFHSTVVSISNTLLRLVHSKSHSTLSQNQIKANHAHSFHHSFTYHIANSRHMNDPLKPTRLIMAFSGMSFAKMYRTFYYITHF